MLGTRDELLMIAITTATFERTKRVGELGN